MANESFNAIEPPDGSDWKPSSPYGLQRFKEGVDGRLVRLADVVRWLSTVRELPFAVAVDRVCAELEGSNPPVSYRLDRTGWAVREDQPSEWFQFAVLKGEPDLMAMPPHAAHAWLAARDMRASWLIEPHKLTWLVNAPGHLEYDETKESPFEFSERTDRVGGPKTLAVPFAVAHALWGWGSVVAMEAAAAAPIDAVADPLAALDADLRTGLDDVCKRRALSSSSKNGAKEIWLDADVETVRKAREVLGRTGAKTLAPLLGISADRVRDLLELGSEKKKRASPLPTVTTVRDGRKVGNGA